MTLENLKKYLSDRKKELIRIGIDYSNENFINHKDIPDGERRLDVIRGRIFEIGKVIEEIEKDSL